MDVKTAIKTGDVEALKCLLGEDAARANALIRWGAKDCIQTHPLHFVSDMLFEGSLKKGNELPLIDALVEAGADLDFQQEGEDGKKGDTPLIGAASLCAEEVGLRLLSVGARPELLGMFGETALHWASMLGEERLAAALIAGSDLNLKDEKHQSPPLGWAIHGCYNPPGKQGRQREVVALLVRAGAAVDPKWLEADEVRADALMLAALRGDSPSSDP